ncbi:MAG: nuclear transport factor 2 family protein [Acidiferrobacterales bacterium]|nr:nuclear transport factor 2 family protein [Acidiferrobacterales bacterium]
MDKTRLASTVVIIIALAVIVFAFTPLRWLIIDDGQNNSSAQEAGSAIENDQSASSDGQAPVEINTLIEDVEALIEIIEEPVEETPATLSETPIVSADRSIRAVARDNIIEFLDQWRQAHERADAERYLQSYSDAFVAPDNGRLQDWQATIRNQLSANQQTSIRLADMEINLANSNSEASVTFEQEIRSDSDYVWSKKLLDLKQQDGQWRIVAESTID